MSNLQGLLDRYAKSAQTQEILDGLKVEKPSRLLLSGLIGGQDCFVLSSIFNQSPHSHIFIASDKEEAAYIQNTLDNLSEDQQVLFFPDSFKRPGVFEELDNNNVLIRTESINKINSRIHKTEILVTYPEAIFEKVVDPKYLDEQKIVIRKEESLDVDTIIEFLIEYGFERTDFVLSLIHI